MTRARLVSYGCLLACAGICGALIVSIRGAAATHVPTGLEQFHAVKVPPACGPNILLVCVDTLRADHVGLWGYSRPTTPAIDSYFGGSLVFERAYATAPSTGPSMVSLLTGLYPHKHGVRLLCQKIPSAVITVVDHLRRAGYQTSAVISNALLSHEACGLGDRFDYYDDSVDEQEPFRASVFERRAARTTDAAIDWLMNGLERDRPHFLWVHYIDPHGPYRPPEDAPANFTHERASTVDPDRMPSYVYEPGLTDGNEYVDRYDEEIAYADREVGRLLEAYESLGLAGDAIIVFTSDHGESMMDHENWFQHQKNVYEEMVRVPLAIRYHKLRPGRVQTAVSLVDVAPTILDLAGLPVPSGLDGVSLASAPRRRDILCEGRSNGFGLWRGLIRDGRKVAARHGKSNIIREAHAFDLRADPHELNPLHVQADDPILGILEELIRHDPDPGGVPEEYTEGQLPSPLVAPTSDPVILHHLRSLGYVGDTEP